MSRVERGKGASTRLSAKLKKEVIILSDSDDRLNEELVPLDPDDSMFKANGPRNRIGSGSSIKTRSASGVLSKRKTIEEPDGGEGGDGSKMEKPKDSVLSEHESANEAPSAPFGEGTEDVSMVDNVDTSVLRDHGPPAKKMKTTLKVPETVTSDLEKKATSSKRGKKSTGKKVGSIKVGTGTSKPKKTTGRQKNAQGDIAKIDEMKNQTGDDGEIEIEHAPSLRKKTTKVVSERESGMEVESAEEDIPPKESSVRTGGRASQTKAEGRDTKNTKKTTILNAPENHTQPKAIKKNKNAATVKHESQEHLKKKRDEERLETEEEAELSEDKSSNGQTRTTRAKNEIRGDQTASETESEQDGDEDVNVKTQIAFHSTPAGKINHARVVGSNAKANSDNQKILKNIEKSIIDDEAEESDGGGSEEEVRSIEGSDDSEKDVDEYDLDDPFIDDSGTTPPPVRNEFMTKLQKHAGREEANSPTIGKGKKKAVTPDWDMSKFEEDDNESVNEYEAEVLRKVMRDSMKTVKTQARRETAGASSSNTSAQTTRRRTFKDLVGFTRPDPEPSMSPMPKAGVNEYRVTALPKKCEVFDPAMQDPLLAEFYKDLPNLKRCILIAWSDHRGPGPYWFTSWASQCPDIDVDLVMGIINFTRFGRFVGPARANPMIMTALKTTPDGFRSNLMIDSEPAILISTMFSDKSFLLSPSPNGLRTKYISGIGHTQEWERQVGFIGMAFGHDELYAQLSGDSLSYTTRPASRTVGATHGFSSLQSQSTRTPQRKTTSNVSSPSDGMSLQATDRVPIYDARSISFNSTTDWPKLANILPPFRGEVPRGSLVVVAYTCNTYFNNQNEWNLSSNVQFVVVLGTP